MDYKKRNEELFNNDEEMYYKDEKTELIDFIDDKYEEYLEVMNSKRARFNNLLDIINIVKKYNDSDVLMFDDDDDIPQKYNDLNDDDKHLINLYINLLTAFKNDFNIPEKNTTYHHYKDKVYMYDQRKYSKNFYEKNKDRLKEKIKCNICGHTYGKNNKTNHFLSKKHNDTELHIKEVVNDD